MRMRLVGVLAIMREFDRGGAKKPMIIIIIIFNDKRNWGGL